MFQFRHCGHAVPLRHVRGFPTLGLLRGLRPIPRPSADDEPARLRHGWAEGRAIRDGSHVHSLTDRRVRRPTVPLQPRHEYAAGLPRGLPTGPPDRLRSLPGQPHPRRALLSDPCPPGLGSVPDLRGFDRWFQHTYTFPSCLPHPARLVVPNRLGVDGAACHPHLRHQVQAAPCFARPAATGREWVLSPHSVSGRLVAHWWVEVETDDVDQPLLELRVVGELERLHQVRLQPRDDQIRCTVAGLTSALLAMDRQLQCVSPSGLASWVSRTISSIFSAGIDGFLPLPGWT